MSAVLRGVRASGLRAVRARLLALAVSLPIACRNPADPARATPEPPSRSTVQVDPALIAAGRVVLGPVTLQNLDSELRAIGYVEPDVTAAADVGALVLARVRNVAVREGDRVRRGQMLAELDAPDAARVAGELARAMARRSRAELALARERRLMESQATSRSDLEQAEAELRSLTAEEHAASVLLDSYGAAGARVSVRAPIAGLVTHVGVVLGSRVEAGDQLFRVVDPEHLLVRAEVLERDAGVVAVGARSLLLVPDGTTCNARVTARGAEVERARHTVSMRLAPEGCGSLISGQVLDVRIFTTQTGAASLPAVPRDALLELDGAPAVFVAGDAPGRFRLVPVLTARVTESYAFLEKGPAPGTSVAVRGAILLKGEWMRASLE